MSKVKTKKEKTPTQESPDDREERVYGAGKNTIQIVKEDYQRPLRLGSARHLFYKKTISMVKGDKMIINGNPRQLRANWVGMCQKTGIDTSQFRTVSGDGCLEIYKVA